LRLAIQREYSEGQSGETARAIELKSLLPKKSIRVEDSPKKVEHGVPEGRRALGTICLSQPKVKGNGPAQQGGERRSVIEVGLSEIVQKARKRSPCKKTSSRLSVIEARNWSSAKERKKKDEKTPSEREGAFRRPK